jgi:hypothetical protein
MESMRRRNSASCSDGSYAGDEGAGKSASGKTGRNTVALARDESDEDDSRTASGESHSSNTTGGTNGSDLDYSSQSKGSTDSLLNQHREVCEEATVRRFSTFIFCVVGSLPRKAARPPRKAARPAGKPPGPARPGPHLKAAAKAGLAA